MAIGNPRPAYPTGVRRFRRSKSVVLLFAACMTTPVWGGDEDHMDWVRNGTSMGDVIGHEELSRTIHEAVAEPSSEVELALFESRVSHVMNMLVLEQGLIEIRESAVPVWIDHQHLADVVEQLNSHIIDSIGFIASKSDVERALESYSGDTIELDLRTAWAALHSPIPKSRPNLMEQYASQTDEILAQLHVRGSESHGNEPTSQHTVGGHCNGVRPLKADNPHHSTYEPGKIKGKVHGTCTLYHENLTWTLTSYLQRESCWFGFVCVWIPMDVDWPNSKSGTNPEWDPNETAVRTPCETGLYRTAAYVCPHAPGHEPSCLWRQSAEVRLHCAD